MLFLFVSILLIIIKGNNEPIIGILALPCESTSTWCNTKTVSNPTSYIPSAYVKWLEGGGSRVVPILPDYTTTQLNELLMQLNGVLFTGGSASFSSGNIWWDQLNNILIQLREFNNKYNKAIPLWATCLGFQGLISATAGHNLNSDHYCEDTALPINFINNAIQSRMFGNSSMNTEYSNMIYNKLNTESLVMNFHKYGVSPTTLEGNKYANENFTILGTQNDNDNKPFVTLIESKDELGLYWYGSQFHPEKPQYEFDLDNGNNNIVHNLDAIISNQYFAEFFVNEARLRNDNTMSSDYYNTHIIYNYSPIIIDNGESTYQQVYVFNKQN
mmetsp:Transcript_1047/g.1398  ORF Transcript_1047/g.1398 Transcript_1047/m.1398 type:complete len:329 (-) Transcript_1047:24-1010(-)